MTSNHEEFHEEISRSKEDLARHSNHTEKTFEDAKRYIDDIHQKCQTQIQTLTH